MRHISHKLGYSKLFLLKNKLPITFHPICDTKQNQISRFISRKRFSDVNCMNCLAIYNKYGDECSKCYDLNELDQYLDDKENM